MGNNDPGRVVLRRVASRPRPFSELFYVAASRPAQITTGSSSSYGRGAFSSRLTSDRSRRTSNPGAAVPLSFSAHEKGILPDRMIAALNRAGAILAEQPFVPDQIQPASLDLRLGAVAYRH